MSPTSAGAGPALPELRDVPAAPVRVVYLAMKPQLRGRIRRNVQTLLELGADVTVLTIPSNREFFVGLSHPALRAEFIDARSAYVRLAQHTSRRSLEQAERRRQRAAALAEENGSGRRALLAPLVLVGALLVGLVRALGRAAGVVLRPFRAPALAVASAVWRRLPGRVRRLGWSLRRRQVLALRRSRRRWERRVVPWFRGQRDAFVGDVVDVGRRLRRTTLVERLAARTGSDEASRRRVLRQRARTRRRRARSRAILHRRLKISRASVAWAKDRLRPWHRVSRFLTFWRMSSERAAELDPDLVVSSDLPGLVGASRVARRLGLPHLHDCHELYLESTSFRTSERMILAPYERRHMRRADAVVAVNESIAVEYQQRYGRLPVVVRNCASRLPPDLGVTDLRLMAGLPTDAQVVLYQGGFSAGRGLEVCVRAAGDLPDGAHLVMLGFGPLRDELVALASELGVADRVHMVDAVAPEDLPACTASATVGLMPYQPVSKNNLLALPNKIFEYTTAGIPVVVSDLPELRRIALGTGCGQVYDPFDPVMLGRALREVLHPDRYPGYRDAARRYGESNVWEVEREVLVDEMVRLAPRLDPMGNPVSAAATSGPTR